MQFLDVPYESQEDNWMCGAAALCMVLRSFGVSTTQGEVWSHIKSPYQDRHRRGSRPVYLARHAHHHRLSALVLRAAQPWELLRRCFRPDVRVIVLHRRGFGSFGLHASVLRGLDETGVVLHDPLRRLDRSLGRDEFLALWGPHPWAIVAEGYLLVVIARSIMSGLVCSCGQPVPETLPCPHCQEAILLQPAVAAGCGRADCREINWQELHCPRCEVGLTRAPAT